MKFTSIACTMSAVSACGWWHHHEGHHHHHHSADFVRKAIRATANSAIKGYFHDERAEPLDAKCLGEDTKDRMKNVFSFHHKVHEEGFWAIDAPMMKQATDSAWDLVFDNINHCQVYNAIYS